MENISKLKELPNPIITYDTDLIVRVSALTIGGSDSICITMNSLESIKVTCYECIGIVDYVGYAVTYLIIGDIVVMSAVVSW